MHLCSQCELCCPCLESTTHLFLECSSISPTWAWLLSLFHLHFSPGLQLHDFFLEVHLAALSFSSWLLWFIALCNLYWCIWSELNKLRHDGGAFCEPKFRQFFVLSLREYAGLAFMPSSTSQNLPIFGLLRLSHLRPFAPRFIPVAWQTPSSLGQGQYIRLFS